MVVANRAALKAAGIDGKTPNPPGGLIDHDASGEPTGILKDNAMHLVEVKLPADTDQLAVDAVKVVSDQAAAVGLTTIHDVWNGGNLGATNMRAYQDAYHRGLLKIRVQLAPGQVLAPEERLTVLQALELFTRNPAYIGFEEKETGSLEVGKLATSSSLIVMSCLFRQQNSKMFRCCRPG